MTATPRPLTDAEAIVLRALCAYIDAHGYPPSVRDLVDATEVQSTSTINWHLNRLYVKGWIVRERSRSRAIRIVRRPDPPPTPPEQGAAA